MKKIFIIICISFSVIKTYSQNVGIGTTSPNAAAQIDISSTTKGVLIPRMTEAEKNAVASPPQGLLVFNTSSNSFQYYNGASWINISHSGIITGVNNRVPKFTGFWGLGNGMMTDDGNGVSINSSGAAANSAAMLDISSSTKGILIPRTSSATRVTIPAVKALMVYDTTTSSFWFNDGLNWIEALNGNSGWKTTGNAGTAVSNFIGTTDNNPLYFRVKNINAGILDSATSNTALGFRTLDSANAAASQYNSAFGFKALQNNITGLSNTAIGANVLQLNKKGIENTALGFQAAYNNDSNYLVSIGSYSGYSNTTGYLNTFIGTSAGRNNVTGNRNTFLGINTGFYSTADNNTFIGAETGSFNFNGSSNTAIGNSAMLFNWGGGNNNTAIGNKALSNNNIGFSNVAVGTDALRNQANRSNIVAIGDSALMNNGVGATLSTHGIQNTALGSKTLMGNTTGHNNTATGYLTLYSNTSGFYNTASGAVAMFFNTTGSSNSAFGRMALYSNSSGAGNTAVGLGALYSNSTTNENTAVGYQAAFNNTTDYMVSIGSYSGYANTSGTWNTFIGTSSGRNNSTGDNNAMLGINSGQNSNGNNNTFIGALSGTANLIGSSNVTLGYNAQTGAAFSNAIAIGANASVTQSNSMALGGIGGNAVSVGIGVTAPQATLDVNGFTKLGSSSPKIQIKKLTGTSPSVQGAIITIPHGLVSDKILSVRVLLEVSADTYFPEGYSSSGLPGHEYHYYIGPTDIYIKAETGNSSLILSKPLKILITYEQ